MAPSVQALGYAGGVSDPTTELMRFGSWDYYAPTGVWTSKDPMGAQDGQSLYQYSTGDSLDFIDPMGLAKSDVDEILRVFNDTVAKLTAHGQRTDPGLWNNFTRSMYLGSLGRAGRPYLGCGE